jgi:hypothetical protein
MIIQRKMNEKLLAK